MMTSITILSLVAFLITGLALIHETRLRRAAHALLLRMIHARSHAGKSQNRSRDIA